MPAKVYEQTARQPSNELAAAAQARVAELEKEVARLSRELAALRRLIPGQPPTPPENTGHPGATLEV